ncbi:MAG TPA: tRNA pseudouridine(55) synthase TruB [Victivallales bacterium]|nr:tRNA pseudouridine(55) synthase TruB [Victivallales bacterium]
MKKENISPFEFSGLLLVDKPSAMTSHDVVAVIKKKFNIRKVGHCGTLDPSATGLLLFLIGHATKLSSILSEKEKIYDVVMQLGIETNTYDLDGKIIIEKKVPHISTDEIHTIFQNFIGEITQIPPMFSACKKEGKKLYELARKGITVERKKRLIRINWINIKKIEIPFIYFSIKCSKGTYVRSICHDIGQQIGCGAAMKSLRRIKSGDYSVKDAFNLETIKTWTQRDLLYALKDPFNEF